MVKRVFPHSFLDFSWIFPGSRPPPDAGTGDNCPPVIVRRQLSGGPFSRHPGGEGGGQGAAMPRYAICFWIFIWIRIYYLYYNGKPSPKEASGARPAEKPAPPCEKPLPSLPGYAMIMYYILAREPRRREETAFPFPAIRRAAYFCRRLHRLLCRAVSAVRLSGAAGRKFDREGGRRPWTTGQSAFSIPGSGG